MFYFQAINCSHVTSRDQYQALRLATVVHVMKSTPLCHRLRSLLKILSQIKHKQSR